MSMRFRTFFIRLYWSIGSINTIEVKCLKVIHFISRPYSSNNLRLWLQFLLRWETINVFGNTVVKRKHFIQKKYMGQMHRSTNRLLSKVYSHSGNSYSSILWALLTGWCTKQTRCAYNLCTCRPSFGLFKLRLIGIKVIFKQ